MRLLLVLEYEFTIQDIIPDKRGDRSDYFGDEESYRFVQLTERLQYEPDSSRLQEPQTCYGDDEKGDELFSSATARLERKRTIGKKTKNEGNRRRDDIGNIFVETETVQYKKNAEINRRINAANDSEAEFTFVFF